ncbi:DMT family transporter [Consotaella salsifontis]|uniref:DMT family transporter n=1 Tax=Consotaella salsifontis TaxID=1365950 RepID=UPI001FD9C65F|nr:DMT family transporter [Consotaella salsifontis]
MTSSTNVLRGIAYILTAGFLIASMDGIGKALTAELPVLQVVWARYFFHTLAMTGMLVALTGRRFLVTKRPVLQITRGALLIVVTVLIYTAMPHISLADATAIQFFAPVLVTLLSALFLGESIGIYRIGAVVAGFAGVLLVVRPGFGDANPYLLLPLFAAFALAGYFMLTRTLSGPQEGLAALFHTTAAGAVVISLLVPTVWVAPTGWQLFEMAALGLFGALGHGCLVRGFAHAPASVLSPFLYSQVLFATIYTIVLFGDSLTLPMMAGTGLLIASGLTIWWRERGQK